MERANNLHQRQSPERLTNILGWSFTNDILVLTNTFQALQFPWPTCIIDISLDILVSYDTCTRASIKQYVSKIKRPWPFDINHQIVMAFITIIAPTSHKCLFHGDSSNLQNIKGAFWLTTTNGQFIPHINGHSPPLL